MFLITFFVVFFVICCFFPSKPAFGRGIAAHKPNIPQSQGQSTPVAINLNTFDLKLRLVGDFTVPVSYCCNSNAIDLRLRMVLLPILLRHWGCFNVGSSTSIPVVMKLVQLFQKLYLFQYKSIHWFSIVLTWFIQSHPKQELWTSFIKWFHLYPPQSDCFTLAASATSRGCLMLCVCVCRYTPNIVFWVITKPFICPLYPHDEITILGYANNKLMRIDLIYAPIYARTALKIRLHWYGHCSLAIFDDRTFAGSPFRQSFVE